jgi:enoyl-CoA hydratase/carnithine racemase
VIIIQGQEDDFSSGANTNEASALTTFEQALDLWHSIRDCLREVREFDLPTIAMITGTCFGGGCLLACACDLRIASTDAMFAIPIARLGLVLDDLTMSSIVDCIGPANTKRLIMTGESISSAEAQRLGLVNQVLPLSQLRTTTMEMANRIASNDPNSLSATKKSVNRIAGCAALAPEVNDVEVTTAFISESFQHRVNKKRSLS